MMREGRCIPGAIVNPNKLPLMTFLIVGMKSTTNGLFSDVISISKCYINQ